MKSLNQYSTTRGYTRHLLRLIATAALLAVGASALAADTAPEIDFQRLEPSKRHSRVSQVVTSLFESKHYRRAKVNDELSSRMLDGYLESLDGNKLYFLASDIHGFERYRHTLDEAMRAGRIEPAFEIFEIYRQRVRERIEHARAVLETEPDFTVDEEFGFDRSELPWASTRAELDDVWRRRVKNDALSLALTGKSWEETAPLLSKRYERVLRRTGQLTADEVFETFMNAYADTLDPHSNYFSPRNSEEYRIQMSLSYEGIGASLQLAEDYVTVLDIIPGGPAAISGKLTPQDRITAVGQGLDEALVDVIGWRLDDVVQMIRGPGGTAVRLQILPGGAAPGSPENVITLIRDKIKLEAQAAQAERLEVERDGSSHAVGVIKVPSFYQDYNAKQRGQEQFTSTTADVRRLIEQLKTEGIDGLVIDLRGNGGGHLWEARAMTGLFIDGPVVQFRSYRGSIDELDDIEPDVAYAGPLAVLVDRFSASASEIFAAAIQDYERGIVIGQRTFGKGSVQNLYDLDQVMRAGDMGQLTLTVGKYYRVTGKSTQLQGVEPDIALPSLVDAEQIGESTRETALPWDEIRPTRFAAGEPLDDEIAALAPIHLRRAASSPDFAFRMAEIETLDELRSRKTVSLNLEKRKQEREATRLARLELENERRAAHGLEPLASPEALEEAEPVDVELHEAVEIVADLAELDRGPQAVKATASETPTS